MGPVDLAVGQVQVFGIACKGCVIACFTGFGQRQKRGEGAGVVQQRIDHGLRQCNGFHGLFHGDTQHGVEQRENAHDKSVVAFFGGHQFGSQQLHQPAAHHGGRAHDRGRTTGARGGQQQGGPAEQLFQAQDHDRMAKRGDLARQAEPRRVDKAQQVERQRRVFFEQVFDLCGAGLFAHQVDELHDRRLRWPDGVCLHQRRFGKPIPLKESDAQIRHELVLFGRFDFFCDQLCVGVCARELHQRFGRFGSEGHHVQLDERRQR